MGAYTRETSPRKVYRRCGSERADKRRKQARRSFSTEDCQNSRSLCRFYSRSTRYEREIQPLPEDTPVSPPRFLSSLSLSLFAVTNFSKNFALGRPITDADPLRGGRSSFETHGEQTGSKEKDFYPTGGPRGFSTARRAVSSASSVRLPGPGTLENVYRAPAWNNIHRIFEGTACG